MGRKCDIKKRRIQSLAGERIRFRKHFFRRAAAGKNRKRLLLLLLLAMGLFGLLWSAGRFNGLLFHIEREETGELRREIEFEREIKGGAPPDSSGGKSRFKEKYGLIFRLKTGELSLYHEKESGQE